MLSAMLIHRAIVRKAFASALVTLGVLGALEAGLTVAGVGWSDLYEGHASTYWQLRSDLDLAAVPHREEGTTFRVETNELGLRDDSIPSAQPWVLALGCSTTFGWGVDAKDSWPEQLEERLGVEVINAGVPGHSSHQGRRFAKELIERKPQVVLLGWGLRDGNQTHLRDADRRDPPWMERLRIMQVLRGSMQAGRSTVKNGKLYRVPPEEFKANVEQVVAWSRAVGATVVALDMTATTAHRTALESLDLPVIRPDISSEERFERDPIHFTAAGNGAIADQVAAVLLPIFSAR